MKVSRFLHCDDWVGKIMLATFVFGMWVYGSTKPEQGPAAPHPDLRFDNGIRNAGSWYDSTNGIVHLKFGFDDLLSLDVLHIDAHPKGSIDAGSWTEYYAGPITVQQPLSLEIPDATNMVIWLWSEYVEPEHVVTNGVFHMNGVIRVMDPGDTNDFFTTFPLRLGEENKGIPLSPDPRQGGN